MEINQQFRNKVIQLMVLAHALLTYNTEVSANQQLYCPECNITRRSELERLKSDSAKHIYGLWEICYTP